ncbi:MAG: helix-turn-helix transcriptional regulator [Chloroflexi bacterium]|nr:helix-turn-helix transcriptional regulator [Chloroflexota bacterium]MCY4248644.1 helix-turn-helix transcriptional regulator [Chloroflexota bacterium]
MWRHIGKSFGSVVRERRLQLGLSQERLAFRCGSHRNYIGEIERGEKTPSLRIIFALAEALEINPSDLVRKVEERELSKKTRTISSS